jgi:NADH dehydrogenase [ubiquinone] 1 alpha subcomplex assembly factor 7
VRRFVRTSRGWHERLVGLSNEGELCFGLAPDPEPGLAAPGEPGQILEAGLAAARLMSRLAARISVRGGALLVIDYGYDATLRGATLQAVKSHRYADPLKDPGEADITAHVDFRALAKAARVAGAEVHGPVAQGEWLARLGLYKRAAALREHASQAQATAIDRAIERLAGDWQGEGGGMAKLFKVLAITGLGVAEPPPGFGSGPA